MGGSGRSTATTCFLAAAFFTGFLSRLGTATKLLVDRGYPPKGRAAPAADAAPDLGVYFMSFIVSSESMTGRTSALSTSLHSMLD